MKQQREPRRGRARRRARGQPHITSGVLTVHSHHPSSAGNHHYPSPPAHEPADAVYDKWKWPSNNGNHNHTNNNGANNSNNNAPADGGHDEVARVRGRI